VSGPASTSSWSKARAFGSESLAAFAIGLLSAEVLAFAVAAANPDGLVTLLELNALGFLFGAVVFALAFLFLLAVSGRRAWSMVAVSGSAVLLAFFHVRKVRLLGLALLPWDLAHARHVLALLPTFAFDVVSVAVLAILVTFLGALVWLVRRPSVGWPVPVRGAVAIGAAALLWVTPDVLAQARVQRALSMRSGLEPVVGNVRATMSRAGLPLTFFWNLHGLAVVKPDGYGESAVRAALEGVSSEAVVDGATHPDLVLVLAESVVDPGVLGVSITPDPMPFLHAISKRFPFGTVTSPVFGGATANAEFEVLAGQPVAFTPDGSLAYTHYVADAVPTFVTRLRAAGYSTRGVHTFHRWFWAREHVYPLLGIDHFDGMERFADARTWGPWVSDAALVDALVQQLPIGDAPPQFQFAITMGTHGTYLYATPGQPRSILRWRCCRRR